MKARSGQLSREEIAQLRQRLDGPAALAFDQAAHLIRLAASPTRLKILYLLAHRPELAVSQLARALGVSPSGVSQQLTKLRGAGLVALRHHRQTHYARLTPHAFNASLRQDFFRPSAPRREQPGPRPIFAGRPPPRQQ
ncbi:MAG TPA: winged helix-turn-helix domain-containing protein [Thermoanaerobaculia bacterium]|nr:winged helix-turn-helix domain-containing protein [Thermoanaerobaculia bacterium]